MAVDTYIFPLVSQTASESITLAVSAATDTGEIKHAKKIIDSRKLVIGAQGNNSGIAAVTHSLEIDGPTGLVVFVDFAAAGLNVNTAAQAAASVTLKRGDNSVLLDADTESACMILTETGFVDGGDLFGVTSGATFS